MLLSRRCTTMEGMFDLACIRGWVSKLGSMTKKLIVQTNPLQTLNSWTKNWTQASKSVFQTRKSTSNKQFPNDQLSINYDFFAKCHDIIFQITETSLQYRTCTTHVRNCLQAMEMDVHLMQPKLVSHMFSSAFYIIQKLLHTRGHQWKFHMCLGSMNCI